MSFSDQSRRLGKTVFGSLFPSLFGIIVLAALSLLGPPDASAQNCGAKKDIRAMIKCLEEKIARLEREALPVGTIVIWSGRLESIPRGWKLCDGQGGRPNLQGRFVVGAGPDGLTAGNTGGSITHDHGGNTRKHALTEYQIPPHSHKLGRGSTDGGTPTKPFRGGRLACFGYHGCESMDTHSTQKDGGRGQGHSHEISQDRHIPPYYALAYIIKVR